MAIVGLHSGRLCNCSGVTLRNPRAVGIAHHRQGRAVLGQMGGEQVAIHSASTGGPQVGTPVGVRDRRCREPRHAWAPLCARLVEPSRRTSTSTERPAYVSEAHLRAHHLVNEISPRSGARSVDQNDRRDVSRMVRFLRVVQDEDPTGRGRALAIGAVSTFLRSANTGDWGTAAAPKPSPTHPEQRHGDNLVRPSMVTRAARCEVVAHHLLRKAGVNEDLSTARAHPLASQPFVKEPGAPPAQERGPPVGRGPAHPGVEHRSTRSRWRPSRRRSTKPVVASLIAHLKAS